MIRKVSCSVAVFLLVTLVYMPVFAQEEDNAQSSSWGQIKSNYRSNSSTTPTTLSTMEQAIEKLQEAETEEEVQEILAAIPDKVRDQLMRESVEPYLSQTETPAWTHPVASDAMRKFNLSPSDILAIQRVVALDNGVPVDSADVVVTEKQWYYSSLTTGELTDTPSGGFAYTREIDIYGTNVEMIVWDTYCWNIEWVVTFYLPVCFYELQVGQFDGIIDAWAPRPNCSPWCNGGLCALYMCGDAWDGAGHLGWWNFNQSCSDPRASKKVGKMVQKRWLHTWQLCHHRSDNDIAHSVRARIRY